MTVVEPSVLEVASADVDAIEALFHRRYAALVRLAAVLVDERGEAEEVVQDGFERLYARVRRSNDVDELDAFLHRSVLNGARSRLRRRRVARAKDGIVRGRAQVTTDPISGVTDAQIVRDAVARLPRRQQECVVLHYFEALPIDRIAAVLMITAGSVKKHLSRGREALALELGEREVSDG